MATTDAVVPNAGETAGKWHGAVSETINVPVDKAWAIAGNFCALNKWMTTVDSCEVVAGEPQKPGCIRYMIGNSFPRADGSKSWAKEQLLTMDEANYHYSYAMLENNFGFEGYTNDFKLKDLGNGTTHVDWAFSVNPIEGRTEEKVAEYMTGVFRKCLGILVDKVNTPAS